MARRRYLSTQISVDKAFNRLAMEAGDFAALLYTLMIPHAGDDGRLTSDPEELLMMVCPGRRDKTPQDASSALLAMEALGLIWMEGSFVAFPPASFYKYQTYIRAENRRIEAENAEDQQPTPQNAEERRESPQNAASPSPSPSPPVPPSPSHSNTQNQERDAGAALDAQPEAAAQAFDVVLALCEELEVEVAEMSGREKSRQAGVAKQLLAEGYSLEDVRGCVRWLKSDAFWASKGIDLRRVASEIGRWVLAGRPRTATAARARASPSDQINTAFERFNAKMDALEIP